MKPMPLLAGALAAGFLLAGCASTPPAAVAPSTPSAAVSTPATKALTPGGEVDKDKLITDMATAGKTVKTTTSTLTMTTKAGDKSTVITGTVDADISTPSHVKSAMTLDSQGQAMKIVVDGDDYYLNLAALGPKWMKMTKADIEKAGTQVPNAYDVGAMYEQMRSSVKKAVYVGEEDVQGVKAKHYTLTLTVDQSGKEMPMDVWVDADNMTRKYRMVSGTATATTTTEAVTTGINKPVTITVPAASDVVAAPKK